MIVEIPDTAPCKTCGTTAELESAEVMVNDSSVRVYHCNNCDQYSLYPLVVE